MLFAYWPRSQDLNASVSSSFPSFWSAAMRSSQVFPAVARLSSSEMFARSQPLSISRGDSESPRSFIVSKIV